MPVVELRASALAPGTSPVRIHYRAAGRGRPVVVLHGGWGSEIYPFDRQVAALDGDVRFVMPDRTGYGRSGRLERFEIDFHQRAADETLAVIAALDLDRPVLWGHSDGAVIALRIAMAAPERIGGVIAEASHFLRHKPASRAFFDAVMADPDSVGERVVATLARDHGDGWRDVIRANAMAWRRLADDRASDDQDLYGGSLVAPRVPVLLVHGARDPRTEPEEFAALCASLDRERDVAGRVAVEVAVVTDGGHSPHSERATAVEVTRVAAAFLRSAAVASVDAQSEGARS
jgi:pimeloyl-ACP methyl ester carboxylesterase